MIYKKQILIGVCGGIAIYKICELIRLLQANDCIVKVVMTTGAQQLMSSVLFESLSQHEVYDDSCINESGEITHIKLAKWADVLLIAPATANTIANLALGKADTLLSAICLATQAKIFIAPAMNVHMWEHLATIKNVEQLKKYDYRILGPAQGELACGDLGFGRMLEPQALMYALLNKSNALANVRVLITIGATLEKLDPVRYLSNFSSGKMGFALVKELLSQGADVTCVVGKIATPIPVGCTVHHVQSAKEMYTCCRENINGVDIFIGAAAVSDYTIVASPSKIKKSSEELQLNFKRTKDILADIKQMNKNIFSVGFCAETNNGEQYLREKFTSKSCDMMILNNIEQSGYPFGDDTIQINILTSDDYVSKLKMTKTKAAECIIENICQLYKTTKQLLHSA